MIALIIALGQTIPIIATAFLTKKKSSILVATVIMLILAAITGNPAFFAMDAIFIGAAHFICVNAIEES